MSKIPRNKAEEERLATAMLEAPKRWEENQHLLLSRAMLGIQLISFQQRLRTIVKRYRDDVQIYLQNTLINPLQALEKGLEAVASNQDEVEFSLRTISPTVDFSNIHQVFVTDIRGAIEELPETIRTVPEHAVQGLVDHALDEVDPVTISLRRVIDYIVEMEFLGPVKQELALWPPRAQRLYAVSQDVQRLVAFQMGDDVSGDGAAETAGSLNPLLEKGSERLRAQLRILEKDRKELLSLINSRLDTTTNLLNPYTITRTEGDLQRYVRGHKRRQIQSRVDQIRNRVTGVINEGIVGLLYRRSEGVLFARQWQETDPYMGSAAIEGIHLVEQIEPGTSVLDTLPLYYRQLFLDLPNITQEFWVGAQAQLQRAEEAVDRWNRGVHGGLLVLGEAFAGKTALCQLIAQTHFKREEVFILNSVAGGSADPDVLESTLKKTFGLSGSIDECFAQLPARSVLIINDLERWWERSTTGIDALMRIVEWIERYGNRCLFLVNANIHAFKLIDRILPLTNHFMGVLTRTPANARQIQEVIMLRHRSAGLQYILKDQPEEEASAWLKARMFTSLFDYSRGNVGAALQAWIVSIRKIAQNSVVIHPLKMLDMTVVENITPVQRALLVHFLLHGQLTFDRLLRISELEITQLNHELQGLQRMGWIKTNEQDILFLNRFLLPHITQAFVERRMI